jgi:hypothetical protein
MACKCGADDLQMLTVKQLAERCSVSRWTVQDWLRAGLPFEPHGRRAKRIQVGVFKRWMATRMVSNGPAYQAARDRRRADCSAEARA